MAENDRITKKLLRPFNKKLLKEDFRKLGVNLITASIVGGLITHAARMTPVGSMLIGLTGIAGFVFTLTGLHRADD